MYPRSFICEEAKIKQRTPLEKELCEIGEEAIWKSRFTSLFKSFAVTFTFRLSEPGHFKYFIMSRFVLTEILSSKNAKRINRSDKYYK